MFKQLVLPNLNPQLTQGREVITNWSGWCLLFGQAAFGTGWAGPSAWVAWLTMLKYKHEDRNIPSGVYVPIWFDGYDNGRRLGHLAIYKDGLVYSSPYFAASHHVVLNSIEEVERIYKMKYVGWSEDIGGVRVIEGGDMPEKVNLDTARILAAGLLGSDGFDGRPDAHKGERDEDLKKYHVGADLTNEYIRNSFFASQQASDAIGYRQGVYAERDRLRKMVAGTQGGDTAKLQAIKDALGIK